MKSTILITLLALGVLSGARPAAAANKEHQQLMADLRILQEQTQLLQNALGAVTETLKAVNTRLDQQTEANRRTVADQKLLAETLANDLRVVREKVDDNNVRVGSLSQEVDALRQLVQQALARMAAPVTTDPGSSGTPGLAAAPPTTGGALAGASPTKTYEQAFGDYTAGLWDLAIDGLEAFLKDFPTSPQAPNAQYTIGRAYMNDGKYDKAIEAFDKAIRNYPTSPIVPDSHYLKGESLRNLKQADRAKDSYETVIKNYPDSTAASLAKQRLQKPN
jgi:tol-pal system protein YbgF